MKSSRTICDGLDTRDRNHDSFIEASKMQERDISVYAGNVVGTTSELGTSKTFDFTSLKSVLPQSLAEEALPRLPVDLSSSRDLAMPYYRQILYSLANDFAGLRDADMKSVIYFLQKATDQRLIQLICNDAGYSSRAIAQSIFKGAIELGDATLIDSLLSEKSLDINVNQLWCRVEGDRFTPIERASLLGYKEAIEVLLRHKADVKRTYPGRDILQGALECAVYRKKEGYPRGDPQIFQMLLNAGGDLSDSSLRRLIMFGYGEFVSLFMSTNAYKNVARWSRDGIFVDAVASLDDETALNIIRAMLNIRADLNFRLYDSHGDLYPCTVMEAAAKHGNVEMIETLLGCGASVTDETLIFAIRSGNHSLVRLLLDRGANINRSYCTSYHCRWPDQSQLMPIKMTPLAEAIRLQNTEIIVMLEQYGAVDLDDQVKFSAAIIAAAEVGDISFIERLVQLRGQLQFQIPDLALGFAARNGQLDAATMLINAGVGLGDSSHVSPLMEALTRHDAAFVHLLLEADALPDNPFHPGHTLSMAVEWGVLSIVEILIHAGAAINVPAEDVDAPLTLAVKRQDHTLVKLLLDNGAEINGHRSRRGEGGKIIGTALEAALRNEDITMASYLLDRGADPLDTRALGKAMAESVQFFNLVLEKQKTKYPMLQARFGCHALIRAIELGDEYIIKEMLEKGLDANSLMRELENDTMKSPFGYAIDNSTVEVMELFLKRGCSPNSIVADCRSHADRQTALLAAVETRNVSKVKLLCRYRADVNFPPRWRIKYTPLQKAAAVGSTDMINLLVTHGADVNAAAAHSSGGTALQFAAIKGFIPVACLLLDLQANVNAPASKVNGRTALEGAAEHGQLDMLEVLLKAGAGSQGTDQGQFEQAKALASYQGHSHIIDFLEDHLRRRRQEEEPGLLGDGTDDNVGICDPNQWTEGIDVDTWDPYGRMDGIGINPMNSWMWEDASSSSYQLENNIAINDTDL